jgi:hypothetical protein
MFKHLHHFSKQLAKKDKELKNAFLNVKSNIFRGIDQPDMKWVLDNSPQPSKNVLVTLCVDSLTKLKNERVKLF